MKHVTQYYVRAVVHFFPTEVTGSAERMGGAHSLMFHRSLNHTQDSDFVTGDAALKQLVQQEMSSFTHPPAVPNLQYMGFFKDTDMQLQLMATEVFKVSKSTQKHRKCGLCNSCAVFQVKLGYSFICYALIILPSVSC